MKPLKTEPASAESIVASALGPAQAIWARPKPHRAPVGGLAKRALDVTVALIMLIVFSPLMAGLALLVFATSPGPVLYHHNRVGYRKRSFGCLKFRTMVANGDEILRHHLENNPDARLEWEQTQKLLDDPRVTPVGHVLRKLSLDELPQLVNVLRGEMSLVGPRPVLLDELRRYGPSSRYYLRARPGITGLWQVSGRNNTTYRRRVAYDRAYVTNVNTATDIAILLQTLPAALRSDETA